MIVSMIWAWICLTWPIQHIVFHIKTVHVARNPILWIEHPKHSQILYRISFETVKCVQYNTKLGRAFLHFYIQNKFPNLDGKMSIDFMFVVGIVVIWSSTLTDNNVRLYAAAVVVKVHISTSTSVIFNTI